MKRAAIITTDADYVFLEEAWTDRTTLSRAIGPSEQLLVDLRMLAYLAAEDGDLSDVPAEEWREIAARVRALLPKEDET